MVNQQLSRLEVPTHTLHAADDCCARRGNRNYCFVNGVWCGPELGCSRRRGSNPRQRGGNRAVQRASGNPCDLITCQPTPKPGFINS